MWFQYPWVFHQTVRRIFCKIALKILKPETPLSKTLSWMGNPTNGNVQTFSHPFFTPQKINILNPNMEVDGSDDFLSNWVIFRWTCCWFSRVYLHMNSSFNHLHLLIHQWSKHLVLSKTSGFFSEISRWPRLQSFKCFFEWLVAGDHQILICKYILYIYIYIYIVYIFCIYI